MLKCEKCIENFYDLFYQKKHSLDSILNSSKLNKSFKDTDMRCAKLCITMFIMVF